MSLESINHRGEKFPSHPADFAIKLHRPAKAASNEIGSGTMWKALAIFFLATICGLQAKADNLIGTGDLFLHPSVLQGYEEFQNTYNPTYFAVSTNGLAYGYTYCPDQVCTTSDDKGAAIRSCISIQGQYEAELRKRGIKSLKGECRIFANASRVLWQGEVHHLSREQYLEWLSGSGFLVRN